MVRKRINPLPIAIPSPRAAPISTYYSPKLPAPRIDPTAAELGRFAEALSKWGYMARQEEKEELKAQGITAAAEFTPDEIQTLVDGSLLPDPGEPADVNLGPGPVALQALTAEEEALRQRFLELRERGLPKNADPIWRKWYFSTLAGRLAQNYASEVSARLGETYELNADTGRPQRDYSELAGEIYAKYEGLVAELGIFGEEAFSAAKASSDMRMADEARKQLNGREEALAIQSWDSGNVDFLINGYLDSSFDEGELEGLAARYKDARFEVPEVREHFVANLKAAAQRFIQMEASGELAVGQGKELALGLIESLVPSGDDKGLILGTSIKNDEMLKGEIHQVKTDIRDGIDQDNRKRASRLIEEAKGAAYPVMLAVAEAGGNEDSVFAAGKALLSEDGLSSDELGALNSVMTGLRHIWDEEAENGEWDLKKKQAFESNFWTLQNKGLASNRDLGEFIIDSGALQGHPNFALQMLSSFRANNTFSAEVEANPQLGVALSKIKGMRFDNGGPEYTKGYFDRQTLLMESIQGVETAEALRLLGSSAEAEKKFAAREREYLKTTQDAVAKALNSFNNREAMRLLDEQRPLLSDSSVAALESKIDKSLSEWEAKEDLRKNIALVNEAGRMLSPKYKNWKLRMVGAAPVVKHWEAAPDAEEAARIFDDLTSTANDLFDEGIERGDRRPEDLISDIMNAIQEQARREYEALDI